MASLLLVKEPANAHIASYKEEMIQAQESSQQNARTFIAPARVNLIGEHTDYTGGLVMPMAIPFTTRATIAPSHDGGYHFNSQISETARTLSAGESPVPRADWSDYPVGVLKELLALDIVPPPFTLHFEGDIPLGSGLSSSASVEVATAIALLHHAGASLLAAEIATLCRRAENNFVGSPCGIMDQFVVTNAVHGHALLLNTRDLIFDLLSMQRGRMAQCAIVVANSGVKHSIASGEYGVRRRELEVGQAVLLARFPQLRDLRDATLEQLAECESAMSAESVRRCRHIISENTRVREAARALEAGDPELLGGIITRAHASERDDFECSVEEVDFLVETAVALPNCYGARLTGGGFGGCTVNLVQATVAEAFATSLREAYLQRFGIAAETYLCTAVDGAVARAAHSGDSSC
jgi:galactokinase